ncbi:MAG: M28 family peptidase [Bacteroidales bacterium]|jgi:hypothetical protein|nr:M28 family peptidase [Bacteroidales bacterium]
MKFFLHDIITLSHLHILLFSFLLFSFLLSPLSAQQLINNKGNRNQSYPVVTKTNPEIVNLMNQVSESNIENTIRYMQQYFRVATSPAAFIVQNWLVDKFESYGYEDIEIHYFNYNSQQLDAGNIVVVKKGSELPNEYILVTSHYDHSTADNPVGPGADDNASGTSGVLECARILKNYPTKRSIMFVPFSGEEFWMIGSMPFAQKCAIENMNIIAHFNMDMIGWFPPDNPNTIMASGYSYISKPLFDFYEQTANTYIPSVKTIRLSEGDSYGGDHMPFNVYEYPSLYIGDTEYHYLHPCYHKMCDTIGPNGGVNRLDLAVNFVQAVLSATTELANASLPPQNLSACSGEDNIKVSWDSSGDSNIYKVFRNNSMITETKENSYVDYDVEEGKKYEYYVTDFRAAPSNKDMVTFVKPLILPYSNNFINNKYGFEHSDWVLRNFEEQTFLSNTSGNGTFPDNYLSIAELDWFPIPMKTKDISVRFKWNGILNGIWYNQSNWSHLQSWNNTNLFFEVTNDRKTWHKLAYITGVDSKEESFSLNKFINSDFFQARFRLESSGAQGDYKKLCFVTDFEILFEADTTNISSNYPYISTFQFWPNPTSSFINIITNYQEPYHIAVYDMQGKIIFAQEGFSDGELNVSRLHRGNYLIVASTKQHRVAKKLVVL